MRVSLKKFTKDPYKYAKKAPLILLLGDRPSYAVIPYVTYKRLLELQTQENGKSFKIPFHPHNLKESWIWRLLFT